MSIPSRQIICTNCNYESWMRYVPIIIVYELDNGEKFESGRGYGWCYSCNQFTDVEKIFDPIQINYQIEALSKKINVQPSFWSFKKRNSDNKQLNEELNELSIQLAYAKNRKSLPRCLICANEDIERINFVDGEISGEFKHSCGGNLILLPEDQDSVRFFYKAQTIHLNSEGLRVSLEENTDTFNQELNSRSNSTSTNVLPQIDLSDYFLDEQYQINELFLENLEYKDENISMLEVMYFTCAVITYNFFRFSRLNQKEKIVDALSSYMIDLMSEIQDELEFNQLLNNYRVRYKQYASLMDLIFDPDSSSSGNPLITLSLHTFENITGDSSRNKMIKVVFLSQLLNQFLIKQIEYFKKLE